MDHVCEEMENEFFSQYVLLTKSAAESHNDSMTRCEFTTRSLQASIIASEIFRRGPNI